MKTKYLLITLLTGSMFSCGEETTEGNESTDSSKTVKTETENDSEIVWEEHDQILEYYILPSLIVDHEIRDDGTLGHANKRDNTYDKISDNKMSDNTSDNVSNVTNNTQTNDVSDITKDMDKTSNNEIADSENTDSENTPELDTKEKDYVYMHDQMIIVDAYSPSNMELNKQNSTLTLKETAIVFIVPTIEELEKLGRDGAKIIHYLNAAKDSLKGTGIPYITTDVNNLVFIGEEGREFRVTKSELESRVVLFNHNQGEYKEGFLRPWNEDEIEYYLKEEPSAY